jgi:hypothetical protein
MEQSYHSVVEYVDKATNLAEHVKRCLQKRQGQLDSAAVLALNEFTIAANNVSEFMQVLEEERKRIN